MCLYTYIHKSRDASLSYKCVLRVTRKFGGGIEDRGCHKKCADVNDSLLHLAILPQFRSTLLDMTNDKLGRSLVDIALRPCER